MPWHDYGAMMIDFEDKQPAKPLSRGERVLLGILGALTVYGFAAQLATAAGWIASLFS